MSVRGIDTQIMVTRSADYSRDVGAMAKKPELTQEQLAAIQKANAAIEQKKIKETSESEMDKLRTDKDGDSSGSGGFTGGGSEKEQSDESSQHSKNMLVPPGNNVIDIKI